MLQLFGQLLEFLGYSLFQQLVTLTTMLPLCSRCMWDETSGQSYKASMLVNYVSGVVSKSNLLVITSLES